MAGVTGAVLVMGTWAVLVVMLAAVGMPLAALTHRGRLSWADVRRALWWGLLVFAIVSMLLANEVALASEEVLVIALVGTLVGAIATAILIRRRGWINRFQMDPGALVVAVTALIVACYLAVASLGPVTNFDSGLYHLSAIAHAMNYPTIPGLANLYAPLGYANASFPMAAALGSSPWGEDSFRLLNGLVIVLVLLDLTIRWFSRDRGAGAYGLLVGSVALSIPTVALADYWVTSPSQDSAVFAVTVAASAMVMGAVAAQRNRPQEVSAAVAAALILVLLRPTMGTYLLAVMIVAVVLLIKSPSPRRAWVPGVVVVAIAAGASAVAQILRDVLLSGWILYPLSVLPVDVTWRAADPVGLRTATLGYHRDPTDLWSAATGWQWIGPWMAAVGRQWETWALLVMLTAVTIVALVGHKRRWSIRWRGLLLAVFPSLITTVLWWIATPPSFRFIWGPLFTLATIPLGWLIWRSTRTRPRTAPAMWVRAVPAACAAVVIVVVGYSAVARLDVTSPRQEAVWTWGPEFIYAVVPVPVPAADEVELERGLLVQVPKGGQLCWGLAPACTPEPDPRAGLLEPAQGIAGGLSIS